MMFYDRTESHLGSSGPWTWTLELTHGRLAKCQERDTGLLYCEGQGDSEGES